MIYGCLQVWDGEPWNVLAVEPSPAMASLGKQIQGQDRHRTTPAGAATIRWVPHLADVGLKGVLKRDRGRHRCVARNFLKATHSPCSCGHSLFSLSNSP
jgi:hypothetical protein